MDMSPFRVLTQGRLDMTKNQFETRSAHLCVQEDGRFIFTIDSLRLEGDFTTDEFSKILEQLSRSGWTLVGPFKRPADSHFEMTLTFRRKLSNPKKL